MTHLGSRWTLLGAVLIMVVAVSGSPAEAQVSPATLAGITTITATTASSSAQATVPRDVSFGGSCYPESTAKVSGSADSVSVALIPNADPGNPIFFGRFPKAEGGSTFSTLCGPGATLKAGRYTLVMLRTSGTATLSLRLSGLSGRKAITLTPTRSGATIKTLAPVHPYSSSQVAASFGAPGRLTAKGIVMVFGWMRAGVSLLSSMGDCEVDGPLADTLPLALAEAPGCPAGGSGSDIPGPAGSGTKFHAGGVANTAPSSYTAGLYYLSQAPAQSAGGFAVWIPSAS